MAHFDLKTLDHKTRYKILSALVVPRPIALVTTVDKNGIINAAPFSFFNVMGANPPIVAFAPGDQVTGEPKDTAQNIQETKEFVVNLVDESIAEKMNLCSATLAPDQNELEFAGLTAIPSQSVKPPLIKEAPASLECKELFTMNIGKNRIVLGQVQIVHMKDDIIDTEKFYINAKHYKPIGRMYGRGGYTKTQDLFEMIRPK